MKKKSIFKMMALLLLSEALVWDSLPATATMMKTQR